MAITTSEQLHTWQTCLESTLQILKSFAGQTEDQFLQLGERLQDFAIRSGKISSTANELVEVVSGDESRHLTAQLQQLFNDMETYLAQVRARGETSCQILQQVLSQLDTVVQPLEGFQKMDKVLRMLSISTKIESARIGELGAGFTTLALDVEKLSHAVNEKSAGIMSHRQSLELLIRDNLEKVRTTGFGQHADAARILADVSAGINTLLSLNETCSKAGLLARQTAAEVSDEIASVVSSMQFHDITRQQIEHVVEALEKLRQQIHASSAEIKPEACRSLVAETGDICELQAAQIRHAADQLKKATLAILGNLQNIAQQQNQVSLQLQSAVTGNAGTSDTSLLDTMQRNMREVVTILKRCAAADEQLSTAMAEVATTTIQISGFVSDIEAVGSEINLIALNAQIKAAHTGPQGAALGVLAEAIKRLSLDAVVQTEDVSNTLKAINSITVDIQHKSEEEKRSVQQVAAMEQEAEQIISRLGRITTTIHDRLSSITSAATALSEEINAVTASVHVHEEASRLAHEAETVLEQIYREARALVPASPEFSNNLRHMEQRYTMESERMIHEMMAARHGAAVKLQGKQQSSTGDSGFGDNVDLF